MKASSFSPLTMMLRLLNSLLTRSEFDTKSNNGYEN
jgi:hypothetical protein